ncbi:MAG: acyloxyacyl hydrolase [Candidatus Omnitrophica bacterium]|nr:acyloxyacyl hydrolase [Candidatus Omnitrophota bacterium]
MGYGSTKVTDKDRYVTIPTYLRLGIDCDKFGLGFSDWIERGARDFFHKDFRPRGTTEFLIEPFVSYVPSPNQNMEGGFIIAFKYEWPLTEKFHPYIWNGGGVMYITQHLREEALQVNFTPQIGGGFHYFIEKNKALNFEYRYRHFSNANLKLPNDGVNQGFISLGISWFY